MLTVKEKFERRKQRVRRVLKKNAGGALRISVHRSCKHIYVQVIDDEKQITLASASTLEEALRKRLGGATSNIAAAHAIGERIAEKLSSVSNSGRFVFDRGGRLFHGKVKAVADAMKAKGIKF